MFLQARVCPCWEYLTRYTPPGPGTPPWDQVHLLGPATTPQGPGTPPRTRYTPQYLVPLRTRYTPHPRYTPLGPGTPPWDQVHPPLGPGTPPRTRYSPRDQVHPPGPGTPPWDQVHPPRYGHSCGRYASYWNAFLLLLFLFVCFVYLVKRSVCSVVEKEILAYFHVKLCNVKVTHDLRSRKLLFNGVARFARSGPCFQRPNRNRLETAT